MRIVGSRVFAAGNIYGATPVVTLRLSEGSQSTSQLASIFKAISGGVPLARKDLLDFPCWQLLESGAEPATVNKIVEALALMVQRWFNWPVSFSGAENGLAVFEIRHPEAGLRAADCAIELFDAAGEGDEKKLRDTVLKKLDAFGRETSAVTPTIDSCAVAAAARRLSIPWSILPGTNYLRLGHGCHANVVLGSETTQTSSMGRMLAKNKTATSAILGAAGLPVATQRTARTAQEALKAAEWIGFPVVVKPATGNMGRSVTVGISDGAQLLRAFEDAQTVSKSVVIESIIQGSEYRLLVVGGRFFAASCRRPAQVKGDGTSTVNQLVESENRNPSRHAGMHANLRPIRIDDATRECLSKQGLSLDSVPTTGQVVLLRHVSNVSQGGTAADVTDSVHLSIRSLSERAASVLGIDVCGVDFITTDISRPYWETGGAICEVNTRPGLSLHLGVVEGLPRDAALALVQNLYPAGSRHSIPLVAVLTEDPHDELAKVIQNAAGTRGQRIGFASRKRVSIDSNGFPLSASSHLVAGQVLVFDPTLDGAVVCVGSDAVVEHGLGFEHIDLAVLPANPLSSNERRAGELLKRIAREIVYDDDVEALNRALKVFRVTSARSLPAAAMSESFMPSSSEMGGDSTKRQIDADFTMLFLGDIGFGESYSQGKSMTRLRDRLAIEGYEYSLSRLSGLLGKADLVVGNLEVPLSTTPNAALHPTKQYLHWCDPDQTIACLEAAGINALSLANNHSLDCGEAGLNDTLSKAEKLGIVTFGAGRNLQQAGQPFIRTLSIGPTKRTVVIFGGFEFRPKYADEFNWYAGANHFGTCVIDPATIAGQIKLIRTSFEAPMFIAYPHWGVDYQDVRTYQRDMAAQLIEAGVDLVVGHGAHVLQGLEAVNGRPVLYGLGNFVFNSPGRFGKLRALPYGLAAALRFRVGNQAMSASLRLYPLLIDNEKTEFQNRPVSDQEFPEALSLISRYYGGQLGELKTGRDFIGHYVDVPVEA